MPLMKAGRRNSKMRVLQLALVLLCLSFAAGCTMAPNYVRPEAPIPAAWPESADSVNEPGRQMMPWDSFFTDPVVRELVSTSLANNRDFRVALLNIEKARAQYYIQRADLLPTINAGGDMSAQYLPNDLSGTGQAGIYRQYSVTVGFSAYELDLFGRIRSLKESALQSYFATEEAAKATQTSLVSEVVSAYLQLTADRELLALAVDTYENRKNVYALVQAMFEQGLVSQLDLNQSRTGVEEARVSAAQWRTRVAQDANALILLVGASLPPELALAPNLSAVPELPDLPEGLPSDLMERRPDIMMAERQLMAANADIGAARANFFPRLSITTAIGTLTTQYKDLFSGGAGTWLFQPSATLPIFDTGRNWATLQATKAQRDIAVAQYEKSIQTAFREVADALAQRATIGEQLAAEAALVDATRTSYELALARYQNGLDSYMTVLDSQRSYFNAQQGLINTKLLRETNTLNLYKALGGGWEQTQADAAQPESPAEGAAQ